MALLERVSTLLRANLNDLLAKAEDPEKLLRQLVLDMENQLLQVKTQVAIAIADQHSLLKKKTEQQELQTQWLRKAELAVAKKQDDLARSALERSLSHQALAEGFEQQHADQSAEADTLRSTYTRLQQKLAETQAQVELLTAQHRRNRAEGKMKIARSLLETEANQTKLTRLKARVEEESSQSVLARTMLVMASSDGLEERFAAIEKEDKVEALLLELKGGQPRLPEGE